MDASELLWRLLRKSERLLRSKKRSNGNTARNKSCSEGRIYNKISYQAYQFEENDKEFIVFNHTYADEGTGVREAI